MESSSSRLKGTKKVRCVFPNGSSRVVPVGPCPTVNTFRLIARNHINTQCTDMQLRYGAPPTYTTVRLNEDGTLMLKDRETVWLDVCLHCKGNKVLREAPFDVYSPDGREQTPLAPPHHLPPLSGESLSQNGYYYELASRELGLENFTVYSFSSCQEKLFLYLSSKNRLIEVPKKLLCIQSEETVPEEFLTSSGVLYELIRTHVSLTHMSFYSFPVLPGRLFVFDVGLDRLIEIGASSPLAHALLGPVGGKAGPQSRSEQVPLSIERSSLVFGEESCVQVTAAFYLQFESFQGLQSSGGTPSVDCARNHLLSVRDHSTNATRRRGVGFEPECTRVKRAKGKHRKFSVADVTVYEPSSLDVPLPRPSLQLHCSPPPCVYYTETDDDPR